MKNKEARYERIYKQLEELLSKPGDICSKQATIVAILYHKLDYFFWCGFYTIRNDNLLVATYQGPVACQLLERSKGVCWAAIEQGKTLIVENVEHFPGHIACDSRSKSEIVVPYKDENGRVIGVLDVDSGNYNSFDSIDAKYLEMILQLLRN